MNKLSIGSVLLMALAFFSCETDIDINAEPTDITVVYGLINPTDSIHYIKINKAFLGDGNALDFAADADNYNYAENELTAVVSGNGKSYPLTRVTNEIPKDDGVFDNNTNVLYKFIEPNINRNSTYSIEIDNVKLNKKISSETKIVGISTVDDPLKGNTLHFYKGSGSNGDFTQENLSISAGDNIGRVQAYFVFNYIEHYTDPNIPSVPKKVLINLGEKKISNPSNNQVTYLLKGSTFFDEIKAKVSDPSNIPNFSHRELDNISIEYSVAENELNTYMEASAPSTTVNQDKPKYSNITNGVGIFSSRHYDATWKSNKDAASNLNIGDNTKSYLFTLGLGFCFGSGSTATNPCN